MKKACITMGLLLIIIVAVLCGTQKDKAVGADAYLRMHVRANSNAAYDQAVKYRVRDAVVDYLTPLVAECESKQQAMSMLKSNLNSIGGVATEVLRQAGYAYGATATLREESFPTRVYEGVTLGQGVYDALIINLGSGEGDNWWCVVYPPLCFTGKNDGSGQIKYRSKILEIISRFQKRSGAAG